MMKLTYLLCASAILLATSCNPFQTIKGDGDLVTETLEISDYTALDAVCHSAKINYVQSPDAPGLRITTDRNIYEMYEFTVKDGDKLVIQPKREFRKARFVPTEFTVVTRSHALKDVELAGQVNFDVDSPLTGDRLSVEIAGSGSATFNDSVQVEKIKLELAGSATISLSALRCQTLNGEIAGSGTFNLGGSAAEASYDIAGSGTIKALNLRTDVTNCDLAGSGNLEIFAEKHIDLDMAGSGHVRYKGNPSIHQEGLSVGSIERIE